MQNLTNISQSSAGVVQLLNKATMGSSSSAPLITASTGTTNWVDINVKLTAASGIQRGLLAYAEFSGTQVSTTVNNYAIRGYSKISGTLTSGNGYATGVQGKIEISGTLGSGARTCGVLAQINASGGTLSSGGEIMGLWIDSQLTTKGSATARMLAIENTVSGVTFNSMIYSYGKATYLLEVAGSSSTCTTAGTTKTTPGGVGIWLNAYVDGAAYFIPCYASTTT